MSLTLLFHDRLLRGYIMLVPDMPIKVEEIEVKEETIDAEDTKTMIIELQHTNGHVLNSRLQSQPLHSTAGN